MNAFGLDRYRAACCVGLVASGALVGCRKPPPDEIVFTGVARPAPGASAGPQGSAGSVAQPGPAASGGAGGAPVTSTPAAGGSSATPVVPAQTACVAVGEAAAPFSKARLISASADCALWHYCSFRESARELETAASVYAVVGSAPNQGQVEQAFVLAMAGWQRAELFRFGPAARSTEPGGKDLRDLIYAWPLRPECKVDEQTVSQTFQNTEFHSLSFSASPLTGRTLSALEYLLFNRALQNNCTQFAAINATGSWAALPAGEIVARRRAYALEVAKDVHAQALALERAWGPDGDDFRARLLGNGPNGALFSGEQPALNAIAAALFYLDLEVKDFKLATPLGLTPECTTSVCPDAVESRHTDLSLSHIRENLVGFRRLFEGCGAGYAGIGFDDWLRDAGAGDLADRMLADLRAAEASANAMSGSLAQLLLTDREAVAGLRLAIKRVTDELKTEVVTLLNLELPAASEGDND